MVHPINAAFRRELEPAERARAFTSAPKPAGRSSARPLDWQRRWRERLTPLVEEMDAVLDGADDESGGDLLAVFRDAADSLRLLVRALR